MEILFSAVCVCESVLVSAQACMPFQSPYLDAHRKACPERALLLMWLFYGSFHIWADPIFYLTVSPASSLDHAICLSLSFRNAWARLKPKHSLSLYHRPREMPGLLIHLRIILKQITFNRQGQGTVKTCDSQCFSGPPDGDVERCVLGWQRGILWRPY